MANTPQSSQRVRASETTVAVSLENSVDTFALQPTGHTYPEQDTNAAQHGIADIETFLLFFADASAWVSGGPLQMMLCCGVKRLDTPGGEASFRTFSLQINKRL